MCLSTCSAYSLCVFYPCVYYFYMEARAQRLRVHFFYDPKCLLPFILPSNVSSWQLCYHKPLPFTLPPCARPTKNFLFGNGTVKQLWFLRYCTSDTSVKYNVSLCHNKYSYNPLIAWIETTSPAGGGSRGFYLVSVVKKHPPCRLSSRQRTMRSSLAR